MNQHEETAYFHTLMAFKQLIAKYGTEQVEYDLNRFVAEFQVHIEQQPYRDFRTGNLFINTSVQDALQENKI